LHAAVTTLL